jgi:hypothetical protein
MAIFFPDVSCLYSTVRNTSGLPRFFGFLPAHGRRLLADEEFTVFGDIREAVINGAERVTSRRSMHAFESAIERGDMEIVNTPAVIFKDTVTGASKMLKLTSGVLGTIDPCWERSMSRDLEPV